MRKYADAALLLFSHNSRAFVRTVASHSLATPSGITPWAVPYYIASRLALCMAAEGVATRVNTRVAAASSKSASYGDNDVY